MTRDRMRLLLFALAVALLVMVASLPARSEVVLRWSPADTTITLNDTASISIWLDDAIPIRTVEAWVAYDTTIVRSISGVRGALYNGLPCFVWQGFEQSGPGQWHGFAVAIGSTCWAVGPGELYRWTFEGIANGTSPVTTVDIRLFAPDASLIADVSLTNTTIRVGDDLSSAPEVPATGMFLGLSPNPFNPRTTLSFVVASPGPARVELYDLRGRNLGTLWHGWAPSGLISIGWDGTAGDGRPLAGGVYLLRLQDVAGHTAAARGMLVK